MPASTWWDTPEWERYEALYGDAPGTRARLLASADWMTRVVDLSLSEAELWQGVRKSYRSLIHKAEREYVITSLDGGYIYSAMKIHEQEAGRMTRPLETWTMQGEWVRQGHGLLVGAGLRRSVEITTAQDEWPRFAPLGLVDMRAYVYCTVWGGHAYYFSAASLTPNVNHALVWAAMEALKAKGVTTLEMGWQGQAQDDKGKAIEFYRRGFGGYDIPAKEAPALCGR